MRIWDIDPGYLNRNSLLGEHRELHAIISIIENKKTGYSKHPETLRWVSYGWALKMRHELLKSEMELRGYTDRSPVCLNANDGSWPEIYIDQPYDQLQILKIKYQDKEEGRIPLPKSAQEFWAQHKYSVMARSVKLYEEFGKSAADRRSGENYSELGMQLVGILRHKPSDRTMRNAIQHMWGYVSGYSPLSGKELLNMNQLALLKEIRKLAFEYNVEYLLKSTALGELKTFLR